MYQPLGEHFSKVMGIVPAILLIMIKEHFSEVVGGTCVVYRSNLLKLLHNYDFIVLVHID